MRCLILGLVLAVGALPCSMASVPRIWAKKPGAESRLFAFERDGKTGFIDATGRVVIPATIPAKLRSVGDFVDGLAHIGGFGLIDVTGRRVFAGPGDGSDFGEGLARHWGIKEQVFFGTDGKERFRIAAEGAGEFSEGLADFEATGKKGIRSFKPGAFEYRDFPGLRGFVNDRGTIVIPAKFAEVGPFRGGLARAVVDGYCRILSPEGWANGSPTSGYPSSCGGAPEDAVAVCPVGFVDRKGEFAIEAKFEAARDFAEGRAAVREGGKWGFIDKRGAWVIRPEFAQAHSFSEGLAAVLVGKKWGFIGTAGTMRIPATLVDEPEDFSGGYAVAGAEGKLFYVDRAGRQRLGPFLEATPFVHGLAAVRRGKGEVEYINPQGKTIFRYRPKE